MCSLSPNVSANHTNGKVYLFFSMYVILCIFQKIYVYTCIIQTIHVLNSKSISLLHYIMLCIWHAALSLLYISRIYPKSSKPPDVDAFYLCSQTNCQLWDDYNFFFPFYIIYFFSSLSSSQSSPMVLRANAPSALNQVPLLHSHDIFINLFLIHIIRSNSSSPIENWSCIWKRSPNCPDKNYMRQNIRYEVRTERQKKKEKKRFERNENKKNKK